MKSIAATPARTRIAIVISNPLSEEAGWVVIGSALTVIFSQEGWLRCGTGIIELLSGRATY
jgi:hypothetical protein